MIGTRSKLWSAVSFFRTAAPVREPCTRDWPRVGYTLLYEVHSDGSAGKLDGFLTIWWDQGTKLYYVIACFNNPSSP